MRRKTLSLVFAALTSTAVAQVSVPVTETTAPSDLFPEVTSTSTNAQINADVLQLAADAREQLGPVLNLGGAWRFPVHVVVMTPDDPRSGKVQEETVSVDALDNTMRIDVTVPAGDPDAHAFVQRQFVTALLWEKYFVNVKTFDAHTRLDLVPVWLIEGLNEWLDRDSGRDRESIVRRAALGQRAPTLADITSWQDISSDRLLGLYQRAFCYYLVKSLIVPGPKLEDFQEWLTKIGKTGPFSAQQLFPTEAGWQRQLLEAPERAHDIIYGWEETQGALVAAETIPLPKEKDDARVCTINNVADFPPSPELTAALQQKEFDLTALELRAHPGWRPILELYRFGISAMINGHPDDAGKLIAQARQKRTDEIAYRQKLQDYVNWFEVTNDYAGRGTEFRSYFATARAMEKIQGDPEHPNPIRTDVLRVESQF